MTHKQERFEFIGERCPVTPIEEALVTVPVAVRAFADIENVEIKCMGSPCIDKNPRNILGVPDAVSRFTISQKICVKIPMVFGAKADVGEAHVLYSPVEEENRNKC